jgi:NTP pyrophosphatase (non-canonical NTP hydrolase)
MFEDERFAAITANHQRREGDNSVITNALCMAEEMGEAIQQIRRYLGHARRGTTLDQVGEEMADIIISTAVTARLMGIDLSAHVHAKLDTVVERDRHR